VCPFSIIDPHAQFLVDVALLSKRCEKIIPKSFLWTSISKFVMRNGANIVA